MPDATIEKILEIKPIEDADFIEVARVQAYWSVIVKGTFKVNDLCVFVQPDSLLKRAEWNKFLWPKNDEDINGNPIRVIVRKFRKQISQGVVFPISIIPNINPEFLIEGVDIGEKLEISHYEKPIPACLAGKIRGNFPSFLRKTDETRLQSYPDVLKELMDKEVVISIKVDGSSCTVYNNGDKNGVCSRNLDLLEDENNSFWKVTRQLDLLNKLKQFGFNAAIQGELYGEGIQDNHLGIKGLDFRVFNVFNIDQQRFLDHEEFFNLCVTFNIPIVQTVYKGKFNFTIEQLQKMANELKYPNGNFAEGIVIRPVYENYSEILKGRLSVKVISENFSLKYKE
jgi:RNA ligase (TIGR02306 family)